MNDTSLISSQETPTPNSGEGDPQVTDNTPAPTGGEGDDKTAAEKMYPNTEIEPGAEGDDNLTPEEKAAKEAAAKEGEDELTDEQKAEKEAADKKAADDKEAEEKAAKEKAEKEKKDDDKKGEPIDLSDIEVELPEGMELNQEALTSLGEAAGELGLSKEDAAGKLVPIGVKLVESAFAKQQADYAETREGWRGEVAADKEIGGADDATRKLNLSIASKGLDAYGSPELRTLLDQTGIGDHPEVLRYFHKVGKTVGDDVIESGGSGDTGKNPLDAMYPSMTNKT